MIIPFLQTHQLSMQQPIAQSSMETGLVHDNTFTTTGCNLGGWMLEAPYPTQQNHPNEGIDGVLSLSLSFRRKPPIIPHKPGKEGWLSASWLSGASWSCGKSQQVLSSMKLEDSKSFVWLCRLSPWQWEQPDYKNSQEYITDPLPNVIRCQWVSLCLVRGMILHTLVEVINDPLVMWSDAAPEMHNRGHLMSQQCLCNNPYQHTHRYSIGLIGIHTLW